MRAVALYPCEAEGPQELTFAAGQVIVDVAPAEDEGWLSGRLENTSTIGVFPGNYVRIEEERPKPSIPTVAAVPSPGPKVSGAAGLAYRSATATANSSATVGKDAGAAQRSFSVPSSSAAVKQHQIKRDTSSSSLNDTTSTSPSPSPFGVQLRKTGVVLPSGTEQTQDQQPDQTREASPSSSPASVRSQQRPNIPATKPKIPGVGVGGLGSVAGELAARNAARAGTISGTPSNDGASVMASTLKKSNSQEALGTGNRGAGIVTRSKKLFGGEESGGFDSTSGPGADVAKLKNAFDLGGKASGGVGAPLVPGRPAIGTSVFPDSQQPKTPPAPSRPTKPSELSALRGGNEPLVQPAPPSSNDSPEPEERLVKPSQLRSQFQQPQTPPSFTKPVSADTLQPTKTPPVPPRVVNAPPPVPAKSDVMSATVAPPLPNRTKGSGSDAKPDMMSGYPPNLPPRDLTLSPAVPARPAVGLAAPLIPSRPPQHAAGPTSHIPPAARARYEAAFDLVDQDGRGTAGGEEVRKLWVRSGLDNRTLGLVWKLVDRAQRGTLGREEFVIGMHLIDDRLRGYPIPERLPEALAGGIMV
ncbi:hypothetical protein HK097_008179 [Rhizophlyctis rosea]|uniref:Uncharacterized protein n=1 Tax=Rhizophlyctis rosea TaxID=64517 RepID=A0AAD5SAK1_9FUNG|nr:hypothetical protein HK097_008179 [Rhizophlyctis rosea]